MALENIETLEKDIAEEMKAKEATVRQVPTVAQDAGTQVQAESPKKSPVILIGVSALFVIIALVAVYFGYTYYKEISTPPVIVPITNATSTTKTPERLLGGLSPEFPDALGRYVTKIQKTNLGYILYINSYPPVFSYMLRNESSYGASLAKSLGVPQETKTIYVDELTPPPAIVTPTPTSTSNKLPGKQALATSSTNLNQASTSSSTQAIATDGSVRDESAGERQILSVEPIPFTFYDTTVSNQNIRVGKSGNSTIYYAFIQEKAVVFSTTIEGILSLKNDILR